MARSVLRTFLGVGVAAATVALGLAAAAHDFWVQPLNFWIQPNSEVLARFQVGHGELRERWDADPARVLEFRSLGPGGATADHRGALSAGSMDQDHPVALGAAGTHVLVLQTSHALSTLPAVRFNDYLRQEGLTPAIQRRTTSKTSSSPGREIYSRRAKALVQVGPATNKAQPWVTRPVGLTLEIVPGVNPYAPTAGARLPVQVLYDGKPLPGATVKLNNLEADGQPVETLVTDATGRANFKLRRTGAWQLNVVWTKPLIGNPKAEFDTTFSSLTFGFPARAASR